MISSLLLLSTLSAPEAFAARLPELALVGVHVEGLSEEDNREAAEALAEAFESTDAVEVVLPDYVSARLKGREELVLADMSLGVGKARLEEGRVLYERAQPDQAIPQLQKAIEELSDGIEVTGQTQDLIEAWLMMGLAYNGLGEAESARSALREVVVLAPTRELDPISYPPQFIELFNGVREEVLAEGTATVIVSAPIDAPKPKASEESAPPPAASVRADGREQGDAPLSIDGLPAGTHHVWAQASGGLRGYARLDLNAGQKQQLELQMVPGRIAAPAESKGGRIRQTERLYTAVGEYCDTPLILLAGVNGEGEVSLQLYSTRTGNFSQPLTAAAGRDPIAAMVDLVPSLAGYVTEAGDVRSDRVSIVVADLDVSANAVLTQVLFDPDEELQTLIIEGGPNRWWLWASIGAVVAGGGATTAALLLNGEPREKGTITVLIP